MVHNSNRQTPVFRAVWHHLNTCKGYYSLEKSWLMKMIQGPFIALRKAALCLLGVSPMKKLWPSDGSKGCSISHCLSFHTPSDLVLQWENTARPSASYCCDKMTGDRHNQWGKWELLWEQWFSEAGDTIGRQGAAEDRATLIWSFLENRLMSFFQNQSLKQTKNQKSPEQNKPQKTPSNIKPSLKGKPLPFSTAVTRLIIFSSTVPCRKCPTSSLCSPFSWT